MPEVVSDVIATDESGRELHPVSCNVIAPAAHIEAAREIAFRHQITVEKGPAPHLHGERGGPASMLPIALSPTGQVPATHWMCSRNAYDNTVRMIAATLSAHAENGWTSGQVFTVEDDPQEIGAKFCQVLGPRDELLRRLGLREVR